MKNLLISLFTATIFVLGVVDLRAQAHIDLGLGSSRIQGLSPSGGERDAFKISAGYQFRLKHSLGIDVVGQLSKEGEKNYSVTYAKLPVMLMYNGNILSFGAGPYMAYGLSDEDQDPLYFDGMILPPVTYATRDNAFDYIKRFDAGIMARIICNVGGGYIGVEGNYGLIDIAKQDRAKSVNHAIAVYLLCGFNF